MNREILKERIEPKTHEGCVSSFSLHFVKPGTLDGKYSRIRGEMREIRELGDYVATSTFDKKDVERRLEQATEFLQGIRDHLAMVGF